MSVPVLFSGSRSLLGQNRESVMSVGEAKKFLFYKSPFVIRRGIGIGVVVIVVVVVVVFRHNGGMEEQDTKVTKCFI